MGNTYGAHIFKQRQVGEREEVKIKLFLPDGTPLDLTSLATDPGDDGEAPSGGAMVFRGVWSPVQAYNANDVVLYDDGDGVKTYIFTENTTLGAPVVLDVNGNQIMKFWDPSAPQVDLVLGPDSPIGAGGYVNPARYDVFVIKVNAAGLLSLRAADTLGRTQDLGAYLWHQKPDETWETVTSDDDGSGGGKPWIRYNIPGTHVMPGLYSYYISKYSAGYIDENAYGTTRITLGGDNTAEIGSFADFPMNKAVLLGIGGPGVSAV